VPVRIAQTGSSRSLLEHCDQKADEYGGASKYMGGPESGSRGQTPRHAHTPRARPSGAMARNARQRRCAPGWQYQRPCHAPAFPGRRTELADSHSRLRHDGSHGPAHPQHHHSSCRNRQWHPRRSLSIIRDAEGGRLDARPTECFCPVQSRTSMQPKGLPEDFPAVDRPVRAYHNLTSG
jgi:hypothetical protein